MFLNKQCMLEIFFQIAQLQIKYVKTICLLIARTFICLIVRYIDEDTIKYLKIIYKLPRIFHLAMKNIHNDVT